jgi:hypothetical protein
VGTNRVGSLYLLLHGRSVSLILHCGRKPWDLAGKHPHCYLSKATPFHCSHSISTPYPLYIHINSSMIGETATCQPNYSLRMEPVPVPPHNVHVLCDPFPIQTVPKNQPISLPNPNNNPLTPSQHLTIPPTLQPQRTPHTSA